MKEIEVDHFGLHIGRLSCGVSREAVEKGPKAPRRICTSQNWKRSQPDAGVLGIA
jgi:hypothetical protein